MIQTTFKVTGFVTVTSEKPLKANEVVITLDAETNEQFEGSDIEEVMECDITSKEISSTTEVK